jgi:hypothetical protein
LLLAEGEGLSDHTLPGLLGLATGPDDRSRHRTALAVHGPTLAWAFATRLSRVGMETLNVLGRAWLHYGDRDPQLALLLFRTYAYLVYDDPAAITALASAIQAGGKAAATAEASLRRVANVTPTAWKALLEALRHGNGRTQRAVLEAIFSLAGNERLPAGGAEELAAVAPHLDRAALADWLVLANGPRVLVQAAALLLGHEHLLGGAQRMAEAVGAALRPRCVSVAAVVAQPPAVLLHALATVGLVPYRTTTYEEQVRAAAEVVAANPGLGVILAQRLLPLLAGSVQDPSLFFPERRDLLNVLAAAAAQSRDLLAPAARLEGWEPLLASAVSRSFFRGARVSALRLLGCGGRLNEVVAAGVCLALRDTAEAQSAAQQLVAEIESVDDAGLATLAQALVDECPSVAWNAAAVLSALGRNPHLTGEQARMIAQALATAAHLPGSVRAAYTLEEAYVPDRGNSLTLRYLGRLEQAFRHHLNQLPVAP